VSLTDLTRVIEKSADFEKRARVRLEGVSAILNSEGRRHHLTVCGEVHAQGGYLKPQRVGKYTTVYVTAHATNGRVLGQEYTLFAHERFYGFEAFQVTLYNLLQRPAKIRVYPKAPALDDE
jgi:hypothetical protein